MMNHTSLANVQYRQFGATMFLAKTFLYGEQVNFKADTIEEIANWGECHNLQYVRTERELGHGLETFTVFTHDASPLGEHAIERLSRVRFVSVRPINHPQYPNMRIGDGYRSGQLLRKLASLLPRPVPQTPMPQAPMPQVPEPQKKKRGRPKKN